MQIDWTRYQGWPKVVAPNGAVYYKVPESGYLYDPFASQVKKRPVLFIDPSPQVAEKEQAERERQETLNLQKRAASPLGQFIPVVGSVGGTVAGASAINALKTPSVVNAIPTKDGIVTIMSDGTVGGAGTTATAQAAAQGAGLTGGTTLAGPQSAAAQEALFGTGESGASTLGSVTPYLGLAGAGLGAYGLYNSIQANSPKGAALSGAGLGLGLGMAAPLAGFGPLGWGALGLAALGGGVGGLGLNALLGHKSTGEIQAERWQATGHQDPYGKGHDYFAGTGGEQSRDEKYLTPDSIRFNPDNYNNIPDWDSWDKGSQDRFLSTMLSENKVREKKGGIYYDDDRAKELAEQIRKDSTPSSPASQSSAQSGMANAPHTQLPAPSAEIQNLTRQPVELPVDRNVKMGRELARRINNRRR